MVIYLQAHILNQRRRWSLDGLIGVEQEPLGSRNVILLKQVEEILVIKPPKITSKRVQGKRWVHGVHVRWDCGTRIIEWNPFNELCHFLNLLLGNWKLLFQRCHLQIKSNRLLHNIQEQEVAEKKKSFQGHVGVSSFFLVLPRVGHNQAQN